MWLGKLNLSNDASILHETYESLSSEEKSIMFLSPEAYSYLCFLDRYMHITGYVPDRDLDFKKITEYCKRIKKDFNSTSTEISNNTFTVKNSLRVDIGSDFCKRTQKGSPILFGDFESFTNNEIQIIKDKLLKAYEDISNTCSTFEKLIRMYARTIFVRKRKNTLPASEQVDTEIGGIRLLNVHLDSYTHANLMDDLIHESTHNFLSTFETLNFPFNFKDGALYSAEKHNENLRFVSPWSLNPIGSLAFVHAPFVYFALLHFSIKKLMSKSLTRDDRYSIISRRNKYVSGFLSPGSLSGKSSLDTTFDKRALMMIDLMQKIIIDKFGSHHKMVENY